jgi:hypothetical protein
VIKTHIYRENSHLEAAIAAFDGFVNTKLVRERSDKRDLDRRNGQSTRSHDEKFFPPASELNSPNLKLPGAITRVSNRRVPVIDLLQKSAAAPLWPIHRSFRREAAFCFPSNTSGPALKAADGTAVK